MNAVLIVSPEQWGAHSVSKHHYALGLAERGFPVLFLDPPSSGGGVEIKSSGKHKNVFNIKAPSVARGLRFYPAWLRRWLERRWLTRLEKVSGFSVGAVWLFENSRFFDMSFAGERLKIYHQVDLNQDFHVALAACSADVCFCTTDFIKARLSPHNNRTYKIHHGTPVVPCPLPLCEMQENNFQTEGPNAVYVGNLDMAYIDSDLLERVVREFPAVRFHFVGGYTDAGLLRRQTNQRSNVVWWGKVDSTLIPTILARADIVLCIYKAAQFRDQLASPHKFMEYFASGKTIVATYTDEYKDKRHLLEMVDDSAEYVATFERVIGNLKTYNSPSRQAERVEFANQNAYPKQIDKIFSILKDGSLDASFKKLNSA